MKQNGFIGKMFGENFEQKRRTESAGEHSEVLSNAKCGYIAVHIFYIG